MSMTSRNITICTIRFFFLRGDRNTLLVQGIKMILFTFNVKSTLWYLRVVVTNHCFQIPKTLFFRPATVCSYLKKSQSASMVNLLHCDRFLNHLLNGGSACEQKAQNNMQKSKGSFWFARNYSQHKKIRIQLIIT